MSWGGKAGGILAAAAEFNVAADAFVLLDDNPGELSAVAAELPGMGRVYAGAGAAQSERALRSYPRLWPRSMSDSDALRAADVRSNRIRERMRSETGDPNAYLASLEVTLEFERNPAVHRARLAEMCRKTNQFNLALARFDESTVERYLVEHDRDAYTMAMRDRLSDSGIIGCVFTRTDGATLHVDELCISCRALGRGLEDATIAGVLLAAARPGVDSVVFHWTRGDRNAPALEWLDRFTGRSRTDADQTVVPLDRAHLEACLQDTPATYAWAGDERDGEDR